MNWLFRNFNNRVRFALENPLYALNCLCHELTLTDEKFLGSITNVSARRIRGFIEEPSKNGFFSVRLRSVRAELQKLAIYSADLYAKKILLQYAAVRAFQPNVVVETGVANGVSSSYLLLALQTNGRGTFRTTDNSSIFSRFR